MQVILVAGVALALSTAIIGYGMRDGINLFRSPSQVAEAPPVPNEVFRIGGLVEEGSIVRGQGEAITFRVTDGGASIPVSFTGIVPDLFEEGQCTVATGKLGDGGFLASEILAKHDETYMPSEVVEALKEQGGYKDPTASGDS